MSCQNENVDWWSERASDLTIEKCIYVYTILFVPVYGTSQTLSNLCTAFDFVSKFTPGKTIISQGKLLDLRPDSLCQAVPAEITGIVKKKIKKLKQINKQLTTVGFLN